jgi:hypothetical protein
MEKLMSIKIKKATIEDALFLAKMILQNSRAGKKLGMFDLIFEKSEIDLLENIRNLVTTTAKSHCHFSNFLIAQIDSKDVGTLCSYEPRISNRDTFFKALSEVGCKDEQREYMEILNQCNFNLNNRTLMFDFMEEVEGFIDVGILKALEQKSLLTARLKGYRIAQTIVEIGALESLLFYKELGFKELEEKESQLYREKFGRAGLILLTNEF